MATLEQMMSLDVLNECAMECTRQSRWKETTQRYLSDMLVRNIELMDEVLGGTYAVKPTVDFLLNERGHIRKIEAPVVRDRVVQKTLMKHVLIPSLRPYLIYDNYASLTDRGTAFARKRFEVMLRRYIAKNGTDGYILLIDIRKYFENINHEILKHLVDPKIQNEPENVISLIHYMIDTSSHSDKGLNLGSECPQIFAVYFPNKIDHFVKVVKGMKYYGRYMDDMFVIGPSKSELLDLLSEIKEQLNTIGLEVNDKKTHIVKLSHGFTFLQVKYDITKTGKISKRMTHGKIVRERRRLKAFKRMYDQGVMTEEEIWNCYQSWRGTIVKDHNACRHSLASMDALYRSLFPEHKEKDPVGRKALAISINRNAETRDLKYIV